IDKMRLPQNKVFINIAKYGNTSSASIPISLNDALADGLIKRGDIIAMIGFGAGFTYGINMITYMGRTE
ncbi:3-oxoacyl-[acyl-carrier-protein] synthase III C-terminal domain-containing protein, partial [Alicyclobacillus shizuokensis]|uniref:3-oxoacyl-[acyl-carrier-protein] synthase III C-terminal domain-containing protein n=1 Tax=Alicyclobacillus shizuokensis TaxID=392014 RepID=UPI000ABA5CCD